MVPAFEFQSSPKTWEPREELAWFTSFLILVLLIVVGDKFDWQGVGMNAVAGGAPVWVESGDCAATGCC